MWWPFNFFVRKNPIVEKNVALMASGKKNGMWRLLSGESMGGNAGDWQGYPCVGAKFFYDPTTGEIHLFSNTLRFLKEVGKTYVSGSFRLAFSPKRKYLILEMYCADAAPQAQRNLKDSIKDYNIKFGFRV